MQIYSKSKKHIRKRRISSNQKTYQEKANFFKVKTISGKGEFLQIKKPYQEKAFFSEVKTISGKGIFSDIKIIIFYICIYFLSLSYNLILIKKLKKNET